MWDSHTVFETSVNTPLMPTTTGRQRKEEQGHVHLSVIRFMATFIKMSPKTLAELSFDMKVDMATSSVDVFRNTTMFLVTSMRTLLPEKYQANRC